MDYIKTALMERLWGEMLQVIQEAAIESGDLNFY